MSRIERILDKADREGRTRRTTGVGDEASPGDASSAAVGRLDADVARPRRAPAADRLELVEPRAAAPLSGASPAEAPGGFDAQAPDELPAEPLSLSPLLVAAHAPHSMAAEQYRAIRTRIAQAEAAEPGRTYRSIVVTSATAGDGKTLTTLNLALTMAQEFHRRVIAVDADLRNGSLHRLLGLGARPGLADVLAGEVTLDEALVDLVDYGLTVLPAGTRPERPAELLGSAAMRSLTDTLGTQFDRILFDTPPALPLADVPTLAPLADGIILVVRAGRTPRQSLEQAIAGLDPARVLGLGVERVGVPSGGLRLLRCRRGLRARGEGPMTLFKRAVSGRSLAAFLGEVLLIFGSIGIALRLHGPGAVPHAALWKAAFAAALCQLCFYYNDLYDLTLVRSSRELRRAPAPGGRRRRDRARAPRA